MMKRPSIAGRLGRIGRIGSIESIGSAQLPRGSDPSRAATERSPVFEPPGD